MIKAGEALYGARYQRELADNLHVSERTMRRWVAGTSEPPDRLLRELQVLIEARAEHLQSVNDAILKEIKL